MGFRQYFYDAVKELALKREDKFLARNLVSPLEEKLNEPVSSIKVGWYLTRLCDAWILDSQYIDKAPLERIKEYWVRNPLDIRMEM